MKRMFRMALLLLGSMFTLDATANAEDAAGGYYGFGQGLQSCGAYGQARQQHEQDELLFASWLVGYISATNERLPNTYNLAVHTDLAGLLEWLDNYCGANPTSLFGNAAGQLVVYLYPTRQQHK
jgi:hypothetical protein